MCPQLFPGIVSIVVDTVTQGSMVRVSQRSGTHQGAETMFSRITVNMNTGAIAYPKLEGFTLDMDRVYREAAQQGQFCGPELAVRHAIHNQLAEHKGMMGLRA